MGARRFLVLGDEQHIDAARGALALEVDGERKFPAAYERAVRQGLPADVVWVEWIREDPLWSGAADGAYSARLFRELDGVALTRYQCDEVDLCQAAAVFSPTSCNGPDCVKQASDRCFRIVNSRPLAAAPVRRRNPTQRGPGPMRSN